MARGITWVEVAELPNGPSNLKWQHVGVSIHLLYTCHIPYITQFFPAFSYLPPSRHVCIHFPPPSKFTATLLPMHPHLSPTWKPRSHTLSLSSYVIPRPYVLLCHDFNGQVTPFPFGSAPTAGPNVAVQWVTATLSVPLKQSHLFTILLVHIHRSRVSQEIALLDITLTI